jgi:hypothetical protein
MIPVWMSKDDHSLSLDSQMRWLRANDIGLQVFAFFRGSQDKPLYIPPLIPPPILSRYTHLVVFLGSAGVLASDFLFLCNWLFLFLFEASFFS